MSKICLPCAANGKKTDCSVCSGLEPKPRHQIVSEIVRKAAIEHRLEQAAEDSRFKADIAGQREKKEEREAALARFRKKKQLDKIAKALGNKK